MGRRDLNSDKKRAIVEKIATMMREAEPTPFAVEGACRHGIRSSLCLQSWSWAAADIMAADIVARALSVAGARRPTWGEGQPEWTQPGALPIERERCIRCRKPLPEGHWRFCSHVCSSAYNGERRYREKGEELRAQWQAWNAAWSAKQPKRVCDFCEGEFRPRSKTQRFCCRDCQLRFLNAGAVA
jgi:hypothetical protein